ncbi:MAG: hypothetical protein ACMXX7_01775 [Candidatus Woesearchaeota archaeon]
MNANNLNIDFIKESLGITTLFVNSDFCKDSEKYHYLSLNNMNSFYRQGTLLVIDDFIVGSVKNLENNTLILWNDIQGIDYNYPKGYLCSITHFLNLTRTKPVKNSREWGVYEVESLILKPKRPSRNFNIEGNPSLHDLIEIEKRLYMNK